MHIRLQKILCFIPVVNLIPLFLWVGTTLQHRVSLKQHILTLLKMFAAVLLISVCDVALSAIIKNSTILPIISLAAFYLITLTLSCFAVSAQEKILRDDKENSAANG